MKGRSKESYTSGLKVAPGGTEPKKGKHNLAFSHKMGLNFYFFAENNDKVRIKATDKNDLLSMSRLKKGSVIQINVR